MSPCERVWHCLSSCAKGNPFTCIQICIYICMAIQCRKSSIILKRYSSRSSCTLRNHAFMQDFLKQMQYCYIPLVTLLVQKKNTQTGPPPPEKRKYGLPPLENKQYSGTLVQTPTFQRVWIFFFLVCGFSKFFLFFRFRPPPKSMEIIFGATLQKVWK